MAVGMIKAGSHDSIFGSDYHSNSKKLLTRINISTAMTPKDLAKLCKVNMQSGHAKWTCKVDMQSGNPVFFSLLVWNLELNTSSSISL